MKPFLLLAFALAAALCFACANLSGSGGSGTDIPDAHVVGRILDAAGNPVPGTRVSLIGSNYDPLRDGALPDSCSASTDAAGSYRIAISARGLYNVQAIQRASAARLLISNVNVHGDTTKVPDGVLRNPGAVKVILPPDADRSDGYVVARGTTIAARYDAGAGSVLLDSVPHGTLPAIQYVASGAPGQKIIRQNVQVYPGDTLIIAKPAWRFSRRLYLNTSASGAQVASGAANFPVLVRLSNANFNFAEARAAGGDIRFSKSDTTPLSFEIERWDSAGGQAALWVAVDTVHGDNSMQYLVMYWGNPAAPAVSSGPAVFDTAKGFQGVWHLSQAGGAPATDATANHFDGTASGMPASAGVPGIIAGAQRFNGPTGGITIPNTAGGKLNYRGNATFTVSAWAIADTVDSTYFYPVAMKGNFQYGLQLRETNDWEFFTYKSPYWDISRHGAIARTWKLLVGVRNGSRQSLYVDGILAVDTIATVFRPDSAALDTSKNFTIGCLPDWSRYFVGSIDEVRVLGLACSADWIRLCYLNQKSADALVEWRQP